MTTAGERNVYAPDYFRLISRAAHDETVAEFLGACWSAHGRGKLLRGIELGCGLALPSADLSTRGVAMTAIDSSPEMIAAARIEVRARRSRVHLVCADMIRYRPRSKVDLSFSLGLNASHVSSNVEMSKLLRNVAASLRPGGLFVADFEHVLHHVFRHAAVRVVPPWLVFETAPVYVSRVERPDETVEIRFADGTTRYDPFRQVFRSTNTVVVRRGRSVRKLRFASAGKLYQPLEMHALAEQTGAFEVVGTYAGPSLAMPLENHPDSDRFVLVLRRTRAPLKGRSPSASALP